VFKSYVFIDEGLFAGKKDEAELMKTLVRACAFIFAQSF